MYTGHRGLDHIQNLAKMGQMQFKINKCKVLHVGHKNEGFKYQMDCTELQQAHFEKLQTVLGFN